MARCLIIMLSTRVIELIRSTVELHSCQFSPDVSIEDPKIETLRIETSGLNGQL